MARRGLASAIALAGRTNISPKLTKGEGVEKSGVIIGLARYLDAT
jgi:hypothetical protein